MLYYRECNEAIREVLAFMLLTATELVRELRDRVAEVIDLVQVASLLGWDQETMMPPRGALFRATQQAALQGVIHERLTQPRVGELLGELENSVVQADLSEVDRAIVRVIRRDYNRATKLPASLVRELALATTTGLESWRKAREEDRWQDFAPDLARIVDLKRQEAACVGYRESPYDALLDEYEPGATSAQLSHLFDELRRETVALLGRLDRASRTLDRSVVERSFDVRRQLDFTELILRAMGFDFSAGRQDLSTHPFTTNFGPTDVRLTTRADERDLAVALYASIHEGGHGLYEQGIPIDLARTGLGDGASLGVHESQSRLWENFIGRSEPFWRFALPKLHEAFPGVVDDATPAAMVGAVNQVKRSLIRVEADEVTYNLHIIMRFEIERRLIGGEVSVGDLPAVWNKTMRDFLGVTPPDNRSGVLQDTHWAAGLIGYFPTYSLGNVYGAQLWATLRRLQPDLDDYLAAGDFEVVLTWLRQNIHGRGRMDLPGMLIEQVTGEPPNSRYLVEYLNAKYGALYGV
jgi:carboxypeptidase Taq